ncbi:unnamed protein product [Adineta ricciae]|uniref:AMP-dependent synthetase/ligase domain-containing protein n=1 Tax=Adineta ricciae TaxID=249248 RepID=A0A815YR18_ADIRI|nr:unnamed protein product [Adineta ricciae]
MMAIRHMRLVPCKPRITTMLTALQSIRSNSSTEIFSSTDRALSESNETRSDLTHDTVHSHRVEQSIEGGTRTFDGRESLIASNVQKQVCQFANVLAGTEFSLSSPNTVLVILPESAKEHALFRQACLQSGLVYIPCDPNESSAMSISERIRKHAVDCIITDENNFGSIIKYTHNPIRPLKKGLIMDSSASKVLPVGWIHFLLCANETSTTYTRADANENI